MVLSRIHIVMNKSTLRQLIIAEMILADVNRRDHMSPKKRSMLETAKKPPKAVNPTAPRRLRSGEPKKILEPTMAPEEEKAVLTPKELEDLKLKTKETKVDLILGIAGLFGGIAGELLAGPTLGTSLVIGAIPDVINGIRKVNRGDYFDGILDFLCAIPVVGEGAAIFKGLSLAPKIAKLIQIGRIAVWVPKGIRFIKTMISFANPANQKAALHALDEMLSGDESRIKVIAAGTESDNTSLSGMDYIQSLAKRDREEDEANEREENERLGLAENKKAFRLSLVGALYGD